MARGRQEAEAHLDGVAGEIPGGMRLDKRVLEGQPGPALIEEARRQGADLPAVGSHGRSRRAGVLLGSVAARAAHESSCPVLITRSAGAGAFPTAVVVGVDGSDEAWQAWDIASRIAAHQGVAARAVVVSGSAGTTVAAVQKRLPGAERLDGRAAHVLAEIAAPGELLVVGARGMGGLLSLGSVAERVAHHARASVLVVRSAPVPPVADTAGSVAGG